MANRRLDQPATKSLRQTRDPERIGRVSERIARFIGSWRFIAWMTVVVSVWLSLNIFAPQYLRYDEYPFIFLTLVLSLQASYAAPLILLAQNRQADRDRVTYAEDRAHNERLHANSEYLAREISAIRAALGDVATRDYLRAEIRELLAEIKEQDKGTAN